MRTGRSAREPLGKKQNAADVLSLRNLLHAAILVEEARDGVDHILTDSFEQEMSRLGEIGKNRSDRHGKGPWRHHDRRWPPFRVCFPMLKTFVCIEIVAHRIGAFRPIFMKDEFPKPRVAFELQAKQVFGFAFMPVCRRSMNKAADGRHCGRNRIEFGFDVNPRRVRALVKNIQERPAIVGQLFNDQGRERKTQIAAEPLANLDQLIAPAIQPTNSPMLIKCGGDPALPYIVAQCSEIFGSPRIFGDRLEHFHDHLTSHGGRRHLQQMLQRSGHIDPLLCTMPV